MALSKRDQRTLSIIVALLVGFVVWQFGIETVWQSYNDLNDQVEREREKFIANQETLAEAKKIDEDYARVEAQFPQDDPERDPGEVFNEEVISLVEEVVEKTPAYSPPTNAEIKGAPGYEFLILPLEVTTTLDKVAALLREFEKKGYLIQTASITRDSDLDKPDLTLELNIGRIVKIMDDEDEIGPARPGSLRLGRAR